MAQYDFGTINPDEKSGSALAGDLNSWRNAMQSNNSGATAPTVTYPFMWWADTANDTLKQRNAANDAWIDKGKLSAAAGEPNGQATLGGDGKVLAEQLPVMSGTQIQPISASVGSNALTISAPELTLDFRSTTLGSGTITSVTGTPANLVIPSGATLGTINATQNRVVVIAMNNAGTIELAAVNLAGGNNLDETTLISTTAVSTAADSANVVYSTTARTNLPFRVIGLIQSTQATAGTWATAPSLIQGAGGQALAAMSSLGYGQTWQNVTGSRTSGTTYYNTSNKPITVMCSPTGTAGTLQCMAGGINLPLVANTANNSFITTFLVPPGMSYAVTAVTTAINFWHELR